MSNEYNIPATVIPGRLEVYTGPMNSGKSKALIDRLYSFQRQSEIIPFPIDVFKPSADTRDKGYIATRAFGGAQVPAKLFRTNYPTDILDMMAQGKGLVAIDEAQFVFPDQIAAGSARLRDVVDELRRKQKHVLVGGLSLDFRGEVFGDMGYLALSADIVHHLNAICHCGAIATRTQRYVGEKPNLRPAHYTDPISMPGDKEYAAVCHEHHIVPGKPGSDLSDRIK